MANELLKALGIGSATIGGGAALHGAGLGSLLTPLDYPRQALWNTFRSPLKALETGDATHLLGALPGLAGGVLGGLVGGPVGVLAGSALGGALQGIGQATGREEFDAPSVSDLTGTEDFLPNLAVGMATDPLTYAGLSGTWGAGKAALAGRGAKAAAAPVAATAAEAVVPAVKAAEEAVPVAKLAPPVDVPVAKRIAPTYYSKLEEGIGRLPEEMNSQSVLNQLKKLGVKDEEIAATDIARALEGKKRVTRQDLLNYFGENKVQVGERWHNENLPLDSQVRLDQLDSAMADVRRELHDAAYGGGARDEALVRRLTSEFRAIEDEMKSITDALGPPTIWDEFQTPGGKAYKELVLTLPEKKLPPGYSFKSIDSPQSQGGKAVQIVDARGTPVMADAIYPDEGQALAHFNRRQGNTYTNRHWEGVDNPLAHVRFNDRVGPNGEKILHIEEVQSDWHQGAAKARRAAVEEKIRSGWTREQAEAAIHRDFGYGQPKVPEGARLIPPPPNDNEWRLVLRDGTTEKIYADSAEEAIRDFYAMDGKLYAPDAPFKDNWHELAMKRMIRYAAENGYDAITLNKGEQINAILSSGEKALRGQKKFYGTPGNPEYVETLAEKASHFAQPEKGQIGPPGLGNIAEAEHLRGRADEYRRNTGSLPNWLKKYAKQWGIEIDTDAALKVPNTSEADAAMLSADEIKDIIDLFGTRNMPVTRLNLNKKLLEDVMTRGQPLFQVAGPLAAGAGGSALLAALLGQRQTA